MIVASVCVATFQRPQGLEELLQSLAGQQAAPDFEVIVVDNDPDETARPIVDRFADRLSLVYCVEPVPGVAAVRNRAVASSRGVFLAFIDDDEWAEPDWLAALHDVMVKTAADGVFGEVVTVFDPDVPVHIRCCGLFDPGQFPDRSDLPWWGTGTGNAYIRRSALPNLTEPFDLRYGITGGEDTHLFKTMLDHGSRLVWSTEATVHTGHSSSRAKLSWIFWRAVRYGGTGTEIEWLELPFRRRFGLGSKSARHAARDGLAAVTHWRTDKVRSTRSLVSAAMSAGRAARLFGYRVKIYKRRSR